jgi:hypothetical protein
MRARPLPRPPTTCTPIEPYAARCGRYALVPIVERVKRVVRVKAYGDRLGSGVADAKSLRVTASE